MKRKYKKKKKFSFFRTLLILFLIFLFIPTNNEENIDTNPIIENTIINTNTTDIVDDTTSNTDISVNNDEKENSSDSSTSSNSSFKITFLDVGQADAALIECDNKYMLIDGGNREDSDLIYTVLKNRGIDHLDLVIGTHAHEDHIGGISGALNYADADLVLCPVTSYDSKAFSNFAKYADKSGGIIIPSVGDTYKLGSAKINIIGVNSTSDTNNSSIVLKIIYKNTSFLFTGDAEREAEQVILNSGFDLSSTVLKVGHHGSDTSTTYPFLREIMPRYAVISVGKGNTYGHPHDNSLSRLRDADVEIYRTDLQGDIVCTSDGNNVKFTTEKSVSKDKLLIPGSSYVSNTNQSNTNSSSNNNTTLDNKDDEQTTTQNTYVLNTNTKKFHYEYCSSVDQMKDKNKQIFTGDRKDVIAKGYEPCKRCNP